MKPKIFIQSGLDGLAIAKKADSRVEETEDSKSEVEDKDEEKNE